MATWRMLEADLVGGPHDGATVEVLVMPGQAVPDAVLVTPSAAQGLEGVTGTGGTQLAPGAARYARDGQGRTWRHVQA